jgi:hypothetical protein
MSLIEMFLYPKGAFLIIAFNAHTMAGNLTVWESAVKRQEQILSEPCQSYKVPAFKAQEESGLIWVKLDSTSTYRYFETTGPCVK